ncbi:MAG TPA: Ni/Fe hydrogenase subunit alpha [Desulfomonilaceae bacterium]|nr:Ni/Fe hydrogenase subunit alpha [Desulfomonilaceae bacterium]
MAQKIVIDPITRIEGHGKITISLDDKGDVSDAQFNVTQFRGFEKFCEGRPYYEMPSLVERICGICPISHSIASAKACDAILGVKIPEPAAKLRRLLNCGEYIQSHALSFYHLSAPDLLLGFDAEPAKRNIIGLMAADKDFALDGIRLRQMGQQIIQWFADKRVHPAWVVPGGVNKPLTEEHRAMMLSFVPEAYEIVYRALKWFKGAMENFREEIRTFANFPTMFMGLVNEEGNLEHVDGKLRFIDSKGKFVADGVDPARYQDYIGEAVEPWSYLKSPYFKPLGYPEGIYRVGPAARLNVANGCGMPQADQEWAEFIRLDRGPVMSSFFNHYARLVEILYSIELLESLLNDPDIMSEHVRAFAQPNHYEGVGVVEAPRGTLIHHYKVDEQGLITWANMIVATGNNNLAMSRGILQVAKRFIQGDKISDGALNRVEAIIRAFDPCLSCSTHALGKMPLKIQLLANDGTILDER